MPRAHISGDANAIAAMALLVADRVARGRREGSRIDRRRRPGAVRAARVRLRLADRGAGRRAGRVALARRARHRRAGRARPGGPPAAPDDARVVHVTLTAPGRAAARRVLAARAQAVEDTLAGLDHDERAQMAALAGRVFDSAVTGRAAARRVCRFCDAHACGHDEGRCPVTLAADRAEACSGVSAARGIVAAAGLGWRRARVAPGRWVAVAVGVALATGLLGGLSAAGVVAGDHAARRTIAALAPAHRTVLLSWNGGAPAAIDRSARRALARARGRGITRALMMLATRVADRGTVRLGAVAPAGRWLRLTAGRLPRGRCTAARCEVVAIAGPLPATRISGRGVHLVVVGRGALASVVPLGFRTRGPSRRARGPSMLVSADPAGVDALTGVDAVYRTQTWSATLALTRLHSWQLRPGDRPHHRGAERPGPRPHGDRARRDARAGPRAGPGGATAPAGRRRDRGRGAARVRHARRRRAARGADGRGRAHAPQRRDRGPARGARPDRDGRAGASRAWWPASRWWSSSRSPAPRPAASTPATSLGAALGGAAGALAIVGLVAWVAVVLVARTPARWGRLLAVAGLVAARRAAGRRPRAAWQRRIRSAARHRRPDRRRRRGSARRPARRAGPARARACGAAPSAARPPGAARAGPRTGPGGHRDRGDRRRGRPRRVRRRLPGDARPQPRRPGDPARAARGDGRPRRVAAVAAERPLPGLLESAARRHRRAAGRAPLGELGRRARHRPGDAARAAGRRRAAIRARRVRRRRAAAFGSRPMRGRSRSGRSRRRCSTSPRSSARAPAGRSRRSRSAPPARGSDAAAARFPPAARGGTVHRVRAHAAQRAAGHLGTPARRGRLGRRSRHGHGGAERAASRPSGAGGARRLGRARRRASRGRALRFAFGSDLRAIVRPPTPTDTAPLPVRIDAATAAAIGFRRFTVDVAGVSLPVRVVGTVGRVPTIAAGDGVVLADSTALRDALDAASPGLGDQRELWLRAPQPGRLDTVLPASHGAPDCRPALAPGSAPRSRPSRWPARCSARSPRPRCSRRCWPSPAWR